MSKYTTEIRFICEVESGLSESADGERVETIIANARPKIFNFDYPIFDENYRSVLETKILKHFYTREIGLETYGLWKLKLNTKLNEIMPYYNQLYLSTLIEFDPLVTTKLKRTRDNERHDTGSGTNEQHTTLENGNTQTNNLSNSSMDKYSDTPQGTVQNLEAGTYLTNARQVTDSNTGTITNNGSASNDSNSSARNQNDTFEKYVENFEGYEHMNVSEIVLKWRNTFLNVDMQIINDLEELFMQLW